jgi:hypothetical protein
MLERRNTLTAMLRQTQHDKAVKASAIAINPTYRKAAWPFEKVMF